jgi:PIN domain nuclease of toxin-antitoxin system
MLNLDTHVLLYSLSGRLNARERRLLGNHTWSISAIVLWEIRKLIELGRVEIDLEDGEVERTLRRIHTWPLTLEIARRSCELDVSGDPADQLIAATSVVHQVPLLTRDRALLRIKRVPIAR